MCLLYSSCRFVGDVIMSSYQPRACASSICVAVGGQSFIASVRPVLDDVIVPGMQDSGHASDGSHVRPLAYLPLDPHLQDSKRTPAHNEMIRC